MRPAALLPVMRIVLLLICVLLALPVAGVLGAWLARRVAVMLNHGSPTSAALYRAAAQGACAALGLTPIWVDASTPTALG